MSEDLSISDVPDGLLELFKYAFITNCHLDEASITQEEMKTLEELDSVEVIENFKDLIIDLLNFKKDNKKADTAVLAQRSEQLEGLLQKSEAEVRNHVRIENQLKLHIETTQTKAEKLEKTNTEYKKTIKSLETNKLIEEKTKYIKQLETEVATLQGKVQRNSSGALVKRALPYRSSLNMKVLKKRAKEKTTQLHELKKDRSTGRCAKTNRDPLQDAEKAKVLLAACLMRPQLTDLSKKQDPKPVSSKRKCQSKGHIRSHSDYKAISSKRAPSR